MRAIIARPDMADASLEIELGCLGNQQHTAAARTFRAAKIPHHDVLGIAGELDAHRRLLLDARALDTLI